jgi:arsenate reductase-like glutaredoxin family protein
MKTAENTKIIDKAVDFLRKAAVELEEFQVQASLGKAELEDTYEDTKKKFNQFIHDSKFKMKQGKDKYDDMRTLFDELIVQLNLGKAETVDAFKEQKHKILAKLHDIEVKVKTNESLNNFYKQLLLDIEMFKVKLEILESNLEKGKDNFKANYDKGKQEFLEFVEKFKTKYEKKKEETPWENFQGEMTEALRHFKQAFTKS